MMKNVLVTGGAGFIGSNFVRYILKAEPNVRLINLDLLTYAGGLDTLSDLHGQDRHIFVQGNIGDQEQVIRLMQEYHVDTVVNFAAETHVDRSIVDAVPFVETNVLGTVALLEAVKKVWLGTMRDHFETVRFLHISSDEVYGNLDLQSSPFSEEAPYSPNSPYAASKAASDHFVRAYFATYQVPVIITNCTNNYGPFQHPEKLIPLVISNALSGKDLPLYGDGQQIRDWLYVDDHCEALLAILKTGVMGESYNVGANDRITNLELVQLICDMLDEIAPEAKVSPRRDLIRFVADRPGHDRCYGLDTTKIFNTLAWVPKHSLRAGLKKTITWYVENQDWVARRKENSTFNWGINVE